MKQVIKANGRTYVVESPKGIPEYVRSEQKERAHRGPSKEGPFALSMEDMNNFCGGRGKRTNLIY